MKTKSYFLLALLISLAFTMSAGATVTFQKTYRAAGTVYTSAGIIQTFDGNYCTAGGIGDNNGDFSLIKLNQNGDTLWTRVYGGNLREDFASFDQTQDSGFILCGATYSFSAGDFDAYVVRTDARGNLLWSKNYGGTTSDGFSSIRQTADGGFIAVGTYGGAVTLVKLDNMGAVTWAKTIGGDYGMSVQQTFDKGYIVSGSARATSSFGNILLVKTDSLGAVTWSSIFGGVVGENGACVRQCRDSSYIVTGYTESFGTGTKDIFLLKATQSGGLGWMKTYGGGGFEMGHTVEQTRDNGFIAVGATQSFGPDSAGLSENVYVIKTDALGNTLWTRAYQGVNNYGYAVKQTADTGYIIADWRAGFRITKTDSLGMTACINQGTGTITTTVSPIVTTSTTSGGGKSVTAGSAATLTNYATMILNSTCPNITTGVNSLPNGAVVAELHPNPFSNTLTMEVAAPGISELVLVNVMAQKLLQERFEHQRTISTQNLAPGIYFYELRNAGRLLKSGKIVKQ